MLGERAVPYGDRAVLVDADPGDVAGLHAALVVDPLPGQVDLVPAARTLLVVLDRPPTELDLATLRRLRPAPADADRPRRDPVEVPVVFDGPDLADVAGLTGTAVPDLVARLTGTELTVAFGGFAPGFGYLTGLPAEVHVPRRATPRTRVPAGAVGLAGPYAGIYPRASPGGWQLVGRTELVLFDVDRDPPALLSPGTPVRLRAVG
ncbi:allophanate hydrolase subunit 1 [Blastococcus sp. TBT05-19]|uniref:5-oxoprolinase subunit B family protein n=1 Tax=Blastococcus sp. TBT05-19 TaxID=2250581 RepID=UPI001F2A2191|nr:allophanate hydrolase subunit 1 [Blastococcus sp. TBT05-19]